MVDFLRVRVMVESRTGSDVTAQVLKYMEYVPQETPSGLINGLNTVFTLANTPFPGSEAVYLNGLRMTLTTDYTLVGSTITFVSAPLLGALLRVDYLIND